MATLTSSLIVQIRDLASAPARQIAASIKGIGQAAMAVNSGVVAMAAQNKQAIAAMHGRMLGAGLAALGLAKGLSLPIKAAADFETSMSGIKKVVDFPTPTAFKEMGEQIRQLSLRLPMTANDIARIVAAGGQSGIAREDLLQFAEIATKVGVAWDVSADLAGDALAKLKTSLGLTIPQTALLADAVNHLSNNTASSAPDLLDYTRRVAPLAKLFGMTAEQASAMGAAMISSGFQPEVAATSYRNLGQALTIGASATDRQRKAFAQLGTSAPAVARAMQRNGAGTVRAILHLINKSIPKEQQAAFIHDLFGDEARALAPLITNQKLLAETLGLVGDQSKYAGSAAKEYAEQADTLNNKLVLFKNHVNELSTAVGEGLAPGLNEAMEALKPYILQFAEWAKTHPKVIAGIAKTATALVGLKVATLAGRWGFLNLKGMVISLAKPFTAVGAFFGKTMVAALTGTLRPIGLVAGALGVLRSALMFTGIGALLVGIGAAGKFIADNWKGIGVFFESFSKSLEKAFGEEATGKFKPLLDLVKQVGRWMSGDSWKLDDETWKRWGESAGESAARMAVQIASAMDKIISALASVREAWRTSMWAITGDVKYAPPARPQQQQWQGEGDTRIPVQEASFEPSIDISRNDQNDPYFRHRALRAYQRGVAPSVFTEADRYVEKKSDEMVEGNRARQRSMADVPLSDAWIGAQIAKLREMTKNIPLSDAWLGDKAGEILAPVPRPQRARPRVIDNPEELDYSKPPTIIGVPPMEPSVTPTPAAPPPQIIGVPPMEPSVTPTPAAPPPPTLEPSVDLSPISQLNGALGDVATAIADVTASRVSPTVDQTGVDLLLQKLAAVKRALAEIGPIAVDAANRLQAGGTINRLGRATLSDYGHETGGG